MASCLLEPRVSRFCLQFAIYWWWSRGRLPWMLEVQLLEPRFSRFRSQFAINLLTSLGNARGFRSKAVSYPNLAKLFNSHGINTEACDPSFSVSLDKDQGCEWGNHNGLRSVFAQKSKSQNQYFHWREIICDLHLYCWAGSVCLHFLLEICSGGGVAASCYAGGDGKSGVEQRRWRVAEAV